MKIISNKFGAGTVEHADGNFDIPVQWPAFQRSGRQALRAEQPPGECAAGCFGQ